MAALRDKYFYQTIIGWDIKHMAYLFIILFVFITLLIVLMTFFSPTFHKLTL